MPFHSILCSARAFISAKVCCGNYMSAGRVFWRCRLRNYQVASAATPLQCRRGAAAVLSSAKQLSTLLLLKANSPSINTAVGCNVKMNRLKAQGAPQCCIRDIGGCCASTQNTLVPIPSISDPCSAVRIAHALRKLANGYKNHGAMWARTAGLLLRFYRIILTGSISLHRMQRLNNGGAGTLEWLERNPNDPVARYFKRFISRR